MRERRGRREGGKGGREGGRRRGERKILNRLTVHHREDPVPLYGHVVAIMPYTPQS